MVLEEIRRSRAGLRRRWKTMNFEEQIALTINDAITLVKNNPNAKERFFELAKEQANTEALQLKVIKFILEQAGALDEYEEWKGKQKKNVSYYDDLLKKARYAIASKSRDLVFKIYGMASMARKLEAITFEEFTVLNEMLIKDGLNNTKANLE